MNFNQWRDFLTESKQSSESLLREVTEDELLHIQKALDEMDNSDLAFNKMFDGKMRILLDFKTMDRTSALGAFVDFFKINGYEVDWNKGVLSGVQELHDNSIENQVASLGLGGSNANYKPPQKKKIQMKVGKYLKKVADLYAKQQQYFQKIVAYSRENQIYGRTPERPGQVTGTLEDKALTDEERTNYRRIGAQLDMYDPKVGRAMTPAYAKYWAKNAEYIKNNINTLENDRYSIIITRHPIDVLRMSDFSDIMSCHSPPSQAGGGESYYKCAVAEAHGHGAVAYVVETQQLKEFVGDPDAGLPEIEASMQEGEVFEDDKRYDAGTITPVSRLRLRQVRYYEATQKFKPKTDDYKKVGRNPFEGVQLAVPERRVYGRKIPGIRDRVMKWVTEAQQENMNIVKRDSEPDNDQRVINLNKFIKFGGSYEDNQISKLIAELFGDEGGDGLPANTTGNVVQDTTTEDELDVNLIGGLIEQWQEEVNDIAYDWNNRYQAAAIEGEVQDDGDGSAYISLNIGMRFTWSMEEWVRLPDRSYVDDATAELRDMGYGFLDDSYGNIDTRNGKIVMYVNITPEHVPSTNGMGFAMDPEDFNDFCTEVNRIDDMYDGMKQYYERYFKSNGFMTGGAFFNLARQIVDYDDIDTEWDLETDDPYDPEDVSVITATAKFDFGAMTPELPEYAPEILLKIAQGDYFTVALKTELQEESRKELGTEYYVSTHWSAELDSSNDVILTCQLRITDSGRDEIPALFASIVETHYDLDEIRDDMIRPLVLKMMNSRLPSFMQQNLDENARIVKSWKNFLKG